jgi:transcriptional regulator with XRE-family HTH domain
MLESKLFGKRVRAVRRAAKFTQEAAAEASHLNSKYLGELERGEKRPSFEVIIALARALKVPPEAFFEFDLEEQNEKAIRSKIDELLDEADVERLAQVRAILRIILNR